jgi:hypothetical protein
MKMTYSCKLENFRSEIFQDDGNVDSCLRSNTHLLSSVGFQETPDPTTGELERSVLSIFSLSLRSRIQFQGLEQILDLMELRPPRRDLDTLWEASTFKY